MKYVFLSFSNLKGRNLGCCIVRVENLKDAYDEAKKLGLAPKEDTHVRGYTLENWQEERMELNKFYTREEMLELGHKSRKERILP